MPGLSLEPRYSLDEVFGPDLDAAIANARKECKKLYAEVLSFSKGFHRKTVQDRFDRIWRSVEELADRTLCHRHHWPMVQITIVSGPTHEISISRGGAVSLVPIEDEEVPSRFLVTFRGGLVTWTFAQRWTLDDRAAEGLRAIQKTLKALASFAGRTKARAIARSVGAIDAALASLRRQTPIARRISGLARVVRELIAELIGPAVLSAGGQCALHVPRC